MNFFDLLRKLIFSKKTIAEDLDNEGLQQFVPYMLNRWLSFYDGRQAVFVNETLNRFTGLLDDKNEMYKLYYNLIPSCKYKKISYVKKKKEKEEKEDINIPILARNQMISQREVSTYLDFIKTLPN
jgi:hypothetical protein